MSDQSKFKDEEIERLRRQSISRHSNVDYDKLQAHRDFLLAARTDTPEQFQARLINRGIDIESKQGKKVMAAFWAIRRELRR
jgi:hypothetical protein